ncbi:MAG: 16S rRNA (guanine(527)-N(7))-methyltransferase RsmG [Verrucomicrobia bacterium]|nr:16S rRNA (guanine(527)-N(7))-methyltransferase RsmG [Verrucomicrobiota bacterium]
MQEIVIMDSANDLPLVRTHFPELSQEQMETLIRWRDRFLEWNQKINLVSRKDTENFEEHHVLHSLAIAKLIRFPARARILDVGTGGGLPGLPLAILFPECKFFLLDSIAKKVTAVRDMAGYLQLKNVEVVHKRAEELESKWDFVLGRAVSELPKFLGWIGKNLRRGGAADLPNGVLYLKGSLYKEELERCGIQPHAVHDLEQLYPREYFKEKYLVHLDARSVSRM